MLDDASKNKLDTLFDAPRACNSTRCLLTCFKEKIEKKCNKGHQNLLDALINTILREHGKGKGFEDALTYIMPDYCNKNFTKVKSEQKREPSSSRPLSVGKVNKNVGKKSAFKKAKPGKKTELKTQKSLAVPVAEDNKVTEITLIVDGEV
ncbi:unnamed protein product [Strongylus vulgaris]|uniref:Uncharacterized protein n=1 Tax=Strongylus vulgaris TaxID=40348 RepID=A0A3P7IRJ0_STRVU|nr:unnamed protein product [Strongylus vulgaris]